MDQSGVGIDGQRRVSGDRQIQAVLAHDISWQAFCILALAYPNCLESLRHRVSE
jgi:hypothetical protein